MTRTFSILLTACGLCLLAVTATTPCETKPMTSQQLSKTVGSVDGYCCMPGQRLGCAASNFPTSATECKIDDGYCPTDQTMSCGDASCQAAQAADSCDYSPQLVGRNVCTFTRQQCGTEEVCEEVCEMRRYWIPGYVDPWGNIILGHWGPWVYECNEVCRDVDKYECIPSVETPWNVDPNPVLRSVCDGGTTCTINYGKCQG